MRGRKPKPTAIKKLTGNPGRRHLNKAEPTAIYDLTDPPSWMNESQKAGWRFALQAAPSGLLKMIDRSALAVWVVAEDLHRDASIKIQTHGMLVKSPKQGQPMQSPYLPILNKQASIMLKAAAELGFTPAARCRISIDDKEKATDPLSEFLGAAESYTAPAGKPRH